MFKLENQFNSGYFLILKLKSTNHNASTESKIFIKIVVTWKTYKFCQTKRIVRQKIMVVFYVNIQSDFIDKLQDVK